MRRTGLLNTDLLRVISTAGHGQTVVIADAGLPMPAGVHCIDLAVVPGLPSFLDVAEAVLAELVVESAVVADELPVRNPAVAAGIRALLQVRGIVEVGSVPHVQFKQLSAAALAIVRTGESTPFANVILTAGVPF